MQFIDTHCHIHEQDFPLNREEVYTRAKEAGVFSMVVIGTDVKSSHEAVAFAEAHEGVWASIGIHPHEAKTNAVKDIAPLITHPKVVAVGECGLDYFYNHSPRNVQIKRLHQQLELAQQHNKPLSFHVREAFDDFWPIFDEHSGLKGVLHSFTDTEANLEKATQRGLYIGVNGIATFTKVDAQKTMFASIPLERIVLETDAPFLTPVPKRGTINEPAYVMCIANHMADLKKISPEEVAQATTHNAIQLFSL